MTTPSDAIDLADSSGRQRLPVLASPETGAERRGVRGRRAGRPSAPRSGHRPDKLAMWAVLLGLFLILVAATSSHAAMLAV